MAVIDADGHVIEPLAMFEDIPREFHPRRPIPVFMPTDTHRGDFNGCWIIEGKTFPNIGGKGNTIFFIPEDARSKARDVTLASQTLSDTGARLADLDRFNIDIQIIFPTMFLASAAEDVKLEAALFQAYNTYLSRACAQSKGRIRWAAPIPFRDVKAAVEEIHRARELGAAGVFSMGMVWDRSLDDPAFFPVFEAAADLDMPICLHLGWASPKVTSLFSDGQSFFSSATVPVMWGFMSTMGAGLLKRYPNLRIGFLETGS
ncbi:MAG: amidohydrolase family protein, partial [Deltaproteobacteria bacterium]|nr:amidohydrolase family protein [Deltaproteobacteria bacterium]